MWRRRQRGRSVAARSARGLEPQRGLLDLRERREVLLVLGEADPVHRHRVRLVDAELDLLLGLLLRLLLDLRLDGLRLRLVGPPRLGLALPDLLLDSPDVELPAHLLLAMLEAVGLAIALGAGEPGELAAERLLRAVAVEPSGADDLDEREQHRRVHEQRQHRCQHDREVAVDPREHGGQA